MLSEFYNLWQKTPAQKNIIVLSGAGLSVSSGIPTTNAEAGEQFWGKDPLQDKLNVDNLTIELDKVWAWTNDIKYKLNVIQPSKSHYALVELENYFKENFCLITQNIDNLHNEAGSSRVIELKGNVFKEKILENHPLWPDVKRDEIPQSEAGNFLRPDILMFGEELEKKKHLQSHVIAQQCDIMIIVGTSLELHLAHQLPIVAKKYNEAKIIEINPEKQYCSETDLYIQAESEKILPFIVHLIIDFQKKVKNYSANDKR